MCDYGSDCEILGQYHCLKCIYSNSQRYGYTHMGGHWYISSYLLSAVNRSDIVMNTVNIAERPY